MGEIVCLRSDPAIQGAVVDVIPGGENRYVVYHDGAKNTYYSSQLAPVQGTKERDFVTLKKFNAHLTALQLNHPGLTSLYSLQAARINFVPYQFRPVLKFIRADRPRLLIADEVGVGKTIEAGLILRELQARQEISRVLVVCPKSLVSSKKWRLEMKRFDEDFVPLDGQALRYCISETDLDGEWPERYSRAILPFSLLDEQRLYGSGGRPRRGQMGLLDLDPAPLFDLVVVDEAHHVRNTETYSHEAVRFLTRHANAALFLTATPIQLGSRDLFVLLNLLRPDLIVDEDSFERMSAPNPHVNRAVEFARRAGPSWQTEAREALEEAGQTAWGRRVIQQHPDFQKIVATLESEELDRNKRVSCIRGIERLHTFSDLINRTRRRDIGEFTVRNPETVSVDFTPEQAALHEALIDTQTEILRRLHGDRHIKFMMTTLRQQAASCLFGLAPFIEDILHRRLDELYWTDATTQEEVPPGGIDPSSIPNEIENVLDLARNLSSDDPKLDALQKIIRGKQDLENNKVLLFSRFRHTLHYLVEHLQQLGARVGLVYGPVSEEDREELRHRFSLPKENSDAVDVLLSSEVGCEGLDYQFCDCLINYDLPWNPMRIEQRIGRIDRYGQESDKVLIYNLVTPGTVDADVYERCHKRIGVFRHALGGSEEILGNLTKQIRSVAENLELSEAERQEQLAQIADNDVLLLQEEARLEEQQAELFGIDLPPRHDEGEVARAENPWLAPKALQRLVTSYFAEMGIGADSLLGTEERKTLRLSKEGREKLRRDFERLPGRRSLLRRSWERWLKGGDPHLSITFDREYASEDRSIVFITPIHPLVQQAARELGRGQPIYTALEVRADDVEPGAYPFAIYEWQKRGIRNDVALKPVYNNPELTEKFFGLLEYATAIDESVAVLPDQAVFEALDASHYELWSDAREAHKEYTGQITNLREESLKGSFEARMEVLQDQLNRATDSKIRRMREAEIKNARNDHERRIREVREAENRADIITDPVAFGVMHIRRGGGRE